MNAQEVIELEQSHVLGVYGRAPFVLERGEGSTLYDTEGRAYLDCVAGIAVNALGYNDAGVTQAMEAAAATGMLHVSNLYHTAPHARLAALLCESSFADKVHFCNSGAEANEGAFKFARRYGRAHGGEDKVEILAFTNAFHGRTMGALAATPRPKYQDPFKPLMPGVRFAEFNNLASARAQMDARVCAIIVEPIQGEGGVHVATPEFLTGLRALADEFDALLIYDEVQCGVGRTGSLWAYQGYSNGEQGDSFAPDILTAAKPLAAGLPIGAILMRQRVAATIHKGDHGSTFAGGPLVTSVAHHVVNRIAQPAFLAAVEAKGKLLHDLLEEINSPHIIEIRGKGLMLGVELDIEAAEVVNRGYAEGLILVNAGPHVLRLVPPLVITEAEIHEVVARLTRILHAL
ncbi:MAG TPA: aspartate aminotransferase family protein [Chloroflexi bacterium]|nr:aspartate aminotransferase family protein [Chloroflexota bacterium]HHW85131.1 acetylornithine/succinylornithine family transaminase [Chloroflexota bacterium]